MVVRMARGFARLEFPSTYTMLRDSLLRLLSVTTNVTNDWTTVAFEGMA